jgi:hypothetical protein
MADAGFIVSLLSLILGTILTLLLGFVALMYPDEVRVAFRRTRPGMWLHRTPFNVQLTPAETPASLALDALSNASPVCRQVRDQAAALVQALETLVDTSDNRRTLLDAFASTLAANDRSVIDRHNAVYYAFHIFRNARKAPPPGVAADKFDELVDLVFKYLDTIPTPNHPGSVVLSPADLAVLDAI